MADMLATGASWLAAQRRANMSTNVTYRRGANTVVIPATIAKTDDELPDAYGVVRQVVMRDYIVSASDLVLSSATVQPQRGDLIEETVDGSTYTYRVEPVTGEECWRWSDPFHNQYRIHTKRDD